MPVKQSSRKPRHEEVSFWRSKGPDATEFLRGRYRDFVFAPHSHDRYMIGLVTQGAIEVVEPRRSALVSQGEVTLCAFDQIHWGHGPDDRGWSILATYLPPNDVQEVARDIGVAPKGSIGFSHLSTKSPKLAGQIARLYATRDFDHESLKRSSLLLDVVVEVLEGHTDRSAQAPDVRAETRAVKIARDFLYGHFSQNISLEQLAGACGISRFWLIKAFKSRWGVPPYAYLTNLRVRHAIAQLRDGGHPVAVAHDCGFADQSHLTRTFKRALGVTPGQFRAH